MIRINDERIIEGKKRYIEAACLAADTKPTVDIVTGSLCLEVDTGDVYAFEEVGGTWDKIAELGGGA